MSANMEPAFIRDTRPVAQFVGEERCEAAGTRGWRWCRRDATTEVDVLGGDGSTTTWRLCTQHANRMKREESWRTDIGEDFEVVASRPLVTPRRQSVIKKDLLVRACTIAAERLEQMSVATEGGDPRCDEDARQLRAFAEAGRQDGGGFVDIKERRPA